MKYIWSPTIKDDQFESLKDKLQAVRDVIAVQRDVVSAYETVLNLLASKLTNLPNVYDLSIEALEEVLEVFNTGMYVSMYAPDWRSSANPLRIAATMADSYYDTADKDRPYTATGLTYNLILVGVAAHPDYYQMYEKLQELIELIKRPRLANSPTRGSTNATRSAVPSEPDWESLTLKEIPLFGNLNDQLEGVISSLRRSSRSELVRRQAVAYTAYLNRVLHLIDEVLAAADSITRVFQNLSEPGRCLVLYGTGNTSDVAKTILKAFNKSPFTGKEKCGYVVLHSKASSPVPLIALSTLLGVKVSYE